MSTSTNDLTQLGTKTYIMDGGLETTLIFENGYELPEFAAFPLLDQEKGRGILRDYYLRYIHIARKNRYGFILEGPTWRASQKKLEITGFLTRIPTMKFILIDRVTELEPSKRLTAVKSVSLAEEYLGDHFPAFPVLPGVLLLEGLIESASWLVRQHQGFANSMVLLETAKNVKYKSFAAPGMQIQYTVTASAIEDNTSSFKGVGTCGDEPIVEAKLALRHFNLGDDNPKLAHVDGVVIENLKQRWKLLYSE